MNEQLYLHCLLNAFPLSASTNREPTKPSPVCCSPMSPFTSKNPATLAPYRCFAIHLERGYITPYPSANNSSCWSNPWLAWKLHIIRGVFKCILWQSSCTSCLRAALNESWTDLQEQRSRWITCVLSALCLSRGNCAMPDMACGRPAQLVLPGVMSRNQKLSKVSFLSALLQCNPKATCEQLCF